jgi:squalene-hopene/tetraprenyl-beta-curcumene cyclase
MLAPDTIPLHLRIDRSLALGVRFLLQQQSSDGAWRSDTYGAFRDGYSLTPLVIHALLASNDCQAASALDTGCRFLASAVQPDGTIDAGPLGLSYPVYTAALTVPVLEKNGFGRERNAWLAYLQERQLTEDLGWHPSDREYGGWGYSQGLPRQSKPNCPAPPFTESNLSATVLAVEALRSAGIASDDPALQRASLFVKRCQNYSDDMAHQEPVFDDGGFFFIYDDPVRNKAGVAGRDRTGRERYSSYGSMTADGLRALIACGLAFDEARAVAGRRWLEKNFSAATHPGNFAPDRRAVQASVYFYYCWSLARAMTAAGVWEILAGTSRLRWAEELAEELVRRQQPEGFWMNDLVEVREDDPILATSLAASALSQCRKSLEL